MSSFVYVLKSEKNGSLYIGISQNVSVRLKRHNAGLVRSTKGRKPYQLLGSQRFSTLAEARSVEVELKRLKDPKRVLVRFKEFIGAWLSLVERLVWDQKVGGSNPPAPIFANVLHR